MWPMLAGIGPILGVGVAGYFIDPNNNETSWLYQNGSSVVGASNVTTLANAYKLIQENPKVAVLIDQRTASSGEAIAISFVGRPKTKLFGSTATCGLSTANSAFPLSNSALLILTVSFMADRNKNKFGIPVPPDEIISQEGILNAAINWINN